MNSQKEWNMRAYSPFGMNYQYLGGGAGKALPKSTQIRYPSKIFHFLSTAYSSKLENGYYATVPFVPSSANGIPHARHSGKIHIIHADAHFSWIQQNHTDPYSDSVLGTRSTKPLNWKPEGK